MAGLLSAGPAFAGEAVATDRPPITSGDVSYTFGVGSFTPEYTLPRPGSYELPPIDTVSDHAVVDAAGNATTLAKVIDGRLAVVSFIYGTCAEATGCPMSTAVLHHLDAELARDPELASNVTLVTVSFDPARDTPERLTEMQKQRSPGSTWQFLTARDEAALAPLLDDFGQSISRLRYPDGTWTGLYRHVLKVYLLDRDLRVRNIYSVGFLNPDLVKGDLETLQMERKRPGG
jgi:cytochrome c peroxidase